MIKLNLDKYNINIALLILKYLIMIKNFLHL